MGEGVTYSTGLCSEDKRFPPERARFWGFQEVTGLFRCWSAVDRWQSSLQLEKGAGPEKLYKWNSDFD